MKIPKDIYKVAILGAGESGVGAALLSKKLGFGIWVSDAGNIKEKYRKELIEEEIPFEENSHNKVKILSADVVVKSPGIPPTAPIIKLCVEENIPVVSEIEFASWFTKADIIGITGTNGKTTTTSLTYHLLKEGGLDVAVAGNIGKSFARVLATEPEKAVYVLEISSFQLDDCYTLNPKISVLLNITPDHLYRYGSMEAYIDSKFRIVKNATHKEYFIYNYDDENIKFKLNNMDIKSNLVPFSLKEKLEKGGYAEGNLLNINLSEEEKQIIDFNESSLNGSHNKQNTLAATITANIYQIRKERIRESLKTFVNEPHRLQSVAEYDGVLYINDSKATNINSTWFALESMKRRVVWICGGVDENESYDSIKNLLEERVLAAICLGKDVEKIYSSISSHVPHIHKVYTMYDAVMEAMNYAKKGDAILLSPACKSFDLYNNYEERGEDFIKNVHLLNQIN